MLMGTAAATWDESGPAGERPRRPLPARDSGHCANSTHCPRQCNPSRKELDGGDVSRVESKGPLGASSHLRPNTESPGGWRRSTWAATHAPTWLVPCKPAWLENSASSRSPDGAAHGCGDVARVGATRWRGMFWAHRDRVARCLAPFWRGTGGLGTLCGRAARRCLGGDGTRGLCRHRVSVQVEICRRFVTAAIRRGRARALRDHCGTRAGAILAEHELLQQHPRARTAPASPSHHWAFGARAPAALERRSGGFFPSPPLLSRSASCQSSCWQRAPWRGAAQSTFSWRNRRFLRE